MPPDLKSLCALRSKNPLFAKAAGPLYELAVLGKEKPWHSVVLSEWKALTPSEQNQMVSLIAAPSKNAHTQPHVVRAAQLVHKAYGSCLVTVVDAAAVPINRTSEHEQVDRQQ